MKKEQLQVERFTQKLPGHDCISNPCGRNGCGTRPGASHGISSETWFYAVSDGTVALSIRVNSDVYPATVPTHGLPKGAAGALMTEHHVFPTTQEHVLGEPDECAYLAGGCCYNESSWRAADEFFRQHGTSTFEQPDSFWEQLSLELERRTARLREERIDGKLKKCTCCGGTGVVELPLAAPPAEREGPR